MRVRLLRGDDDNTVLLVYPETRDEHCRVLDTVGCPGGSQGRSRPAGGAYVVTTAAQRERWGLADLAASGRVRVVDEAQALGLLCDGAAGLGAAEAPLAGAAAEVPPPAGGRSVASALESVRALAAPGARIDEVLDALEAAELPRPASETLRRSVRALGSDAAAVDEALDRAEMVLALPWRTREPERFDPAHVAQALDRTHGGLERVKTRLLQVLAACPQTRGPLTVEGVRRNRGAETDRPPALVVRPGPARTPTPVPCLAGPSGTGKTSLAVAVAEALGRTHVRVALGKGNAECLIRGVENGVTGRIVEGLHEAGVGNPVFILEELDRVASDAADALLDVLDPARRSAFRDEHLQVPFDLSAALWIVTATDAGGIPEPVRTRLEVIELPAYGEQEKLAIAQRYLLTRPFGQSQDTPPLALEPAAPARAVASDTARAGPAVVVDREVSSVRELEALWAAPPPQGAVEPWRTEPVRTRLEVIELPAYSEQEKLAIAQRYLLTRPFGQSQDTPPLALEPAAPDPVVASDTARAGPAVVVDREVSSVRELEALWAAPPPQGAVEPWRTAACMGDVRFEAAAIRRVIQSHTNEAGVADLQAKLAAICRQVARRRRPGGLGPEVVTPATVRELLGDGDALPSAVRETIARERRRLSESSDAEAAKTNDWIEWLEHLPWTRRSAAPIDLARTRAALDAGHAGLDHAKACVIEYLAVRRRNPHGAVLCFAGAPGVGKTSLAYGIAEALWRGFVKLSCGGLRDETDMRGHNRTWKDAQPGWILREMRRVGSKDPVFVLDELDKLGRAPAAVLLEVLDPAQHARFRDAFVELPFDLSEVLFITTANEPARIPPALRDRLEIIDLPGYTETEKLAIAETHLIGEQNRAAGLADTPVRFTRGACRRIIRDYTSERGIRQLARCLQAICRKVTLGLETGDASLIRDRITARQVRAFLGEPGADPTDGLERLREQLDAPALPPAVQVRGRQVLEQLSVWASTDPEHARAREYLQCLVSLPWTRRTAAVVPLDLARVRAILDAGHAAHGAVKERLLDYVAVRLAKPDAPSPLLCLVGPPGVGKTSLSRLVAAALGRACAWVACGTLAGASTTSRRAFAPEVG